MAVRAAPAHHAALAATAIKLTTGNEAVTEGLTPSQKVVVLAALDPDVRYSLVAEGGLRQAAATDRASLAGAHWLLLQQSLSDNASFTDTLRACAPVIGELKPQLRALLNYHCGIGTLRTRQMMIDIQSL